ncbi:MAG: cytochrome C [Candidatus Deferrimicrobiaceae bacterium]
MRRNAFAIVAGAAALAMLMGCSMVSPTASVPPKHPEELASRRVDCRECHENISTGALKPYETFRHSIVFIREHSMYASQGQNLCASCHVPSFCQTCHVRNEELKPNTKMGDRPDRVLPHRGDYIVLHQIDGRLDPGSCFRCHGNKNDTKCRACHR